MAAIDVDASFRSLEDCFEKLENVLNCAGNPSKKLREDARTALGKLKSYISKSYNESADLKNSDVVLESFVKSSYACIEAQSIFERECDYIDVAAVGTDLLEDVSCWHLPAYDSLFYHKAIEFDIALYSNSPTNDGDSCIFNLKKANWKLFYDSSKFVLSSISDLIVSCQNLETLNDLANGTNIYYS
ncbi:hypothetical protein TNCV_742401 [Trichonephila clavipes]|nr:hypothetical protein TNCV_742401 [Trichonephila clavipes]